MVPSAMIRPPDDTSRHDAGRSLYGRSTARLPTGPASWPTRQGTCPIMVLRARCGRWLLPTSWPAWPAYNPSLPDAWRGYRVDAKQRNGAPAQGGCGLGRVGQEVEGCGVDAEPLAGVEAGARVAGGGEAGGQQAGSVLRHHRRAGHG